MNTFTLTDAHLAQWHEDGYLMVPGLFSHDEVDLLHRIARADRAMDAAPARRDAQGGQSKLSLRFDLDEGMYAGYARCRRVVDTVETLLGGEVYHYHHKMMLKEPRVGGAWEWHQDYGYWYNDGFLLPDLASCMLAVDRANRDNGCLQVIKGSHKIGRVDHGKTGDQTGADLERVEAALQRMELIYCEMEPGTALFFHSNLLHRSDQNRSEHARWSLIGCYSTRANAPYKDKLPGARYSPLEKLDDNQLLKVGQAQWSAMQPSAAS